MNRLKLDNYVYKIKLTKNTTELARIAGELSDSITYETEQEMYRAGGFNDLSYLFQHIIDKWYELEGIQ